MYLHIAARFHAFVNGLFRPSEERKTWFLYHRVLLRLKQQGLEDQLGRVGCALMLASDIADGFGMSEDHPHREKLEELVAQILDYEDLFLLPHIDWGMPHTTAEYFDLRAQIRTQLGYVQDFKATYQRMLDVITESLNALYSAPSPSPKRDGTGGQVFYADLLDSLPDCGAIVEGMILPFYDKDITEKELFSRLRHRFDSNLEQASGKYPEASPIKDPKQLTRTYFAGTPFLPFMDDEVVVTIPQQTRFEHTHILGGTGHGKTQLLQQLIHRDIVAAKEETTSVIVIDSQGDLIRNLSHLKLFSTEGEDASLADKLIIIDPTDIEHPPALNLFDAGLERMEDYTPRERELAFNSLVDIYGRFFGALLGAELTARQGAVFRYIARLMLTIDGATIHTMIKLMDDIRPFEAYIKKLDPTARQFFKEEFSRKSYNPVRQQIKQRLYTVLSIPTFDRLFSAPKSKINFFDTLNAGSIVLVHTAKDLLKTDGAAIFGRFILSLIEHAIMERATLKESERTPTFLYVDEAQDYFDETIETLLVQGRKQHFGLILAHQSLAQLTTRLRAVLMANTSIKLVGGISNSDARELANDMRTQADRLLSMRKHESGSEFALSVRNLTRHAVKTQIDFGLLEKEPTLTPEEYESLIAANREHVTYKPAKDDVPQAVPEPEPPTEATETADSASETENAGHRTLQEDIARQAKKHGFVASVEYLLPDDKRIDVALFGHGQKVAVEVSVTNREDYELSNMEKALEAGFDTVWMVAPDAAHLEKLEAHIRDRLAADKWSKVLFGSPKEVTTWLKRYKAQPRNSSKVAGYEVEVVYASSDSDSDSQFRLGRLCDL
ncbi:type IV secretory system conjugative DNA transfer family protein [Kordiimonas pumila]|uniref:Type IV secretory system conjugative DNA transfer family protein n=1 Tax=Kordiimonas pumila TaxID=2161677 RepID=A0ABV7D2Y1_9PROT|nr:type IV secretion system DNA-binding domain-containing protein [Kordiimonas pumila]